MYVKLYQENMYYKVFSGHKIQKESIQNCSIGSNNGLALIRHQVIIWINDGLVYWHSMS